MASRNKSRRKGWSDEDVARLRSIWGTMKDADVAGQLGKTVSGVRLKATALNLRSEKGKRAGTRSGEVTYPWSKVEEMLLLKNVGHSSIFELMELLPSRTRAAIESRCRRLGFSPTQGTFTRCGIERETGYDWRQIKRARDAIGQTWKRYGVRKYIISEEQVDEIVDWLKNETRKWSKQWDLDGCRQCGASGSSEQDRHSGDGLCKKCLSGDTRIIVKDRGIVKISSMLGKGEFEVWTGKEWSKTSVIYQGFRKVVRLTMSNGVSLVCTPDHKILSDGEMIRADQMVGRKLPAVLPLGVGFPERAEIGCRDLYGGRLGDRFPRVWNRDVGAFVGFVMGDGCVSKSKYPTVIIALGRRDKSDLHRLASIVSEWCDTKSSVYDFLSHPNAFCSERREISRIQWRSMALSQFLSDIGLDKNVPPEARRIPSSLWTASKDGVAGFVSGLFGSDGAVSVNKAGKIELSMSSVSIDLLRDVQQLLVGFGIRSKIYEYPDRKSDGYLNLYALSVFGIENIKRFQNYIGFFCTRKANQLASALGNRSSDASCKDLTCVSVDPVGDENVYDLLNVGPEARFMANGIIVSNCWDKRRYIRGMSIRAISSGVSYVLTEVLWSELNLEKNA